jgi:acyl-CoA synthetase (NDP forming)
VDLAVVGCVPLTPALVTLPAGQGHGEDLTRPDSVPSRLIRLRTQTSKPFVVVADCGALYDPMARYLEEGGVPVFRTQDAALRLLNVFCSRKLAARIP